MSGSETVQARNKLPPMPAESALTPVPVPNELAMRIDELLDATVARHADRPALQFGEKETTYAELRNRVDSAARELADLGVVTGDRVLVAGRNSVDEVAILFALSRIGAWPVLVGSRIAAAQLDAIAAHCTPRLVVFAGESDAAERRRTPTIAMQSVECRAEDRSATHPQPEPAAGLAADDVAAIIYTSGTTGTPKAAMLSHRNLVFLGSRQRELRAYTENDKTYCPLPLSHIGALSILICLIASGGCFYLADRFTPAGLAAAIRDDGVTVVPGLPPLHVKFLDWVERNPGRFERERVRLVTTSSSPLNLRVKQAVEALYGCPLQNGYGCTEGGMIFQVRLDEPREDTSVGPALPGLDVRIADGDAEVPHGERGEIQVRGPSVFLGYYRNAEATAAAFTGDGWLGTGDVGYLTDENVAFITGRLKESIKRSGYTIYPDEIESALNEHDGIAISAVVAGQREIDDEVVAFVEPCRGAELDADAVLRCLEGRIAPYEMPGLVLFLPALPTLANGKIDRVKLREIAASATGAQRR